MYGSLADCPRTLEKFCVSVGLNHLSSSLWALSSAFSSEGRNARESECKCIHTHIHAYTHAYITLHTWTISRSIIRLSAFHFLSDYISFQRPLTATASTSQRSSNTLPHEPTHLQTPVDRSISSSVVSLPVISPKVNRGSRNPRWETTNWDMTRSLTTWQIQICSSFSRICRSTQNMW